VEAEAAVIHRRGFAILATLAALGLLAVGARAMLAAGASDQISPVALVPAFVFGVWVPLAVLLYAIRRQRLATVVLAFCVGLSVNVVFLADAVPANAATDNTADFFLTQGSGFGCGGTVRDMTQTNSGAGPFSFSGGAGVAYTFCSDTFASAQSLNAGTTVASPNLTNSSGTKDCDVSGELLWWHASTSTTTSLGTPGTGIVPANTNAYTVITWSWATSGVSFADGDRLRFIFTFTGTGSNCNNTVLWSTTPANPSKITVATIVPEGVVGLLLLAPALPVGVRWRKRRRP
jgi:hypothetical protein